MMMALKEFSDEEEEEGKNCLKDFSSFFLSHSVQYSIVVVNVVVVVVFQFNIIQEFVVNNCLISLTIYFFFHFLQFHYNKQPLLLWG